jgi:hypothetical protein
MRPWLRFHAPSASGTPYAKLLREHGAGEGSGKQDGCAEGFHFGHWVFSGFSPYCHREEIPARHGRSGISPERDSLELPRNIQIDPTNERPRGRASLENTFP